MELRVQVRVSPLAPSPSISLVDKETLIIHVEHCHSEPLSWRTESFNEQFNQILLRGFSSFIQDTSFHVVVYYFTDKRQIRVAKGTTQSVISQLTQTSESSTLGSSVEHKGWSGGLP